MTRQQRSIMITRLMIALSWVIITVYLSMGFIASGNTPLRLAKTTRITLTALIPEGWGFFTRSAREDCFLIWERRDSTWIPRRENNFTLKSLGGLHRGTRAFAQEVGVFLGNINESEWVACNVRLENFQAKDTLQCIKLRNPTTTKFLKGEIIIQRVPPIPWAWSGAWSKIAMPSKIVKILID